MTVIEKIIQKQNNIFSRPPITLAFFGDSITHGCFELYPVEPGNLDVAYDMEHAYHNRLRQILNMLYPKVPITIINAGISGDSSYDAKNRLERDVLAFNPDLTVVCFGMNDSGYGQGRLDEYEASLREIFEKIKNNGSSLIFLTPCMKATRINPRIENQKMRDLAKKMTGPEQNEIMDAFMDRARALCAEMDVPVCDCYALWKTMERAGVDTTNLLANDINHPVRELHYMFAYELAKVILGGNV